MNNAKSAVSFDEIIQADRQRRKNEELANEIFGRSRKPKDIGKDLDRKQSRTPSLASRVGVAKRSNSSTNVKPSTFNPPSRPSSATTNVARINRLATAVNNKQQANISTASIPRGPGLTIKGAAGPFTVEASNFAPGTTAADIESAFQTVTTESNGPIELASIRFTSITPTIVAEMVFPEKAMADAVIKTFNGQKADGRILHVHHKHPSSRIPKSSDDSTMMADTRPSPVTKGLFDPPPNPVAPAEEPMEDIDVDMATEPAAYSDERDRSDRERRDRDREREPRHEGEDDRDDRDDRNGGRRDDRDRGDRDRDRDRERERDGHRDRDRERDSSRRYNDRRYERRDNRGPGPQRGGYGGGFDQRGGGGGGRPYGNGMGGGFPRDGGFNDGMMGNNRGGFRGGYRGFGRGRGF